MPSIEQIRQEYREAVASAIEGRDDFEAWNRVRVSLANAVFSAWLSSACKTAKGIPVDPVEKVLYAKSGCGAGSEGNKGFQSGNTCAGDGGGEATSTPEFKSLSESELHKLTTDELMSEISRLEKDGDIDDFPWDTISIEQLNEVDKALKKRKREPKIGVNPLGRAKKLKDWQSPTWDYRGWLIEEQQWDEDDPTQGKAWQIRPDRGGENTREESGLTEAELNFFFELHTEHLERAQSFRQAKIWVDEVRRDYESGEYSDRAKKLGEEIEFRDK